MPIYSLSSSENSEFSVSFEPPKNPKKNYFRKIINFGRAKPIISIVEKVTKVRKFSSVDSSNPLPKRISKTPVQRTYPPVPSIPSASSTPSPVPLRRTPKLTNLQNNRITLDDRSISFGELIEKDDPLAPKWIEEAKIIFPNFKNHLELSRVQYKVGLCYFSGQEKVQMNEAKAYFWIKMSAEKNYHPAQYQLGCWYAEGVVVEQSKQKAMEWLAKAAEQGNATAKDMLRGLLMAKPV